MAGLIPRQQVRGYRQIFQAPVIADNQTFSVDVNRGPHIETAVVVVSGTINVTTAFAGGVRSLGGLNYVKRIDWLLNSSVALDSVSGFQSYVAAGVTRRYLPTVLSPASAVGATSFYLTVPLDRVLYDMVRPKDSLLKTDAGLARNEIKIQLGALADMYLPGAGAATYTNVTVRVMIADYQIERNDRGETYMGPYYIKRTGFRASFNSGSGQQIRLSTGNRLRAIGMRLLDTVNQEPVGALETVISNIRVARSSDTRVDIKPNTLSSFNQLQFPSSVINAIPGCFVIDFANSGSAQGARYSEFWALPSAADTFITLDTVAAGVLDVVTIEGVDFAPAN